MNENTRILMTGANGGLGLETCAWLLEDGYTDLVMGCRAKERGEAARAELARRVPDADLSKVEVLAGMDMTDPGAIRAAIDSLPDTRPFDVIFLQAGGVVFGDDYQEVEWRGHRIERTVFQNLFGAHVTLSLLHERGLVAHGARVILAGGEGARGIRGMIAKPEFARAEELTGYLFGLARPKPYDMMNAIGVSKFAGVLWARELAERHAQDWSTIWFSPGMTYGTKGLSAAPAWKEWLAQNVAFRVMRALGQAQSPRDGARKYADCIVGAIGANGDVLGAPEGKALGALTDQLPMHAGFDDPALRGALWDAITRVVGPIGAARAEDIVRAA